MAGTHPAMAGHLPMSPPRGREATGPGVACALYHSLLTVTLRGGTVSRFMRTLRKAFLRRGCLSRGIGVRRGWPCKGGKGIPEGERRNSVGRLGQGVFAVVEKTMRGGRARR